MTQRMAGDHHVSMQVCMVHVDRDPSHTSHFQRTATTAMTPATLPLGFPRLSTSGAIYFAIPASDWQDALFSAGA